MPVYCPKEERAADPSHQQETEGEEDTPSGERRRIPHIINSDREDFTKLAVYELLNQPAVKR